MNNLNLELPITALCVVTDRLKCPPNYTPIYKSHDTSTETDLWRDSLFGKKINRFICYTKDYPIQDTYNVIEDIKIFNDKDNIIKDFIPIDKCIDTTEKTFQKKVLCIKQGYRFYSNVAVSDLIILVRSKRAPMGYSYIGEINGHSICIKFSQIPDNKSTRIPPSISNQQIAYNSPPPIPPRPPSMVGTFNDPSIASIEQTYIVVNPPQAPHLNRQSTDLNNQHVYNTMQRLQTQHSNNTYNPLHGVPFQINPAYANNNRADADELIDIERLNRKTKSLMDSIDRYNYDFNIEKTCLTSQ